MELIKKNVGFTYDKRGYRLRLSLFKCPVCQKEVQRKTYAGKHAKTCSSKCSYELYYKTNIPAIAKTNICINCQKDDCQWLLNGNPIKEWTATKINYKNLSGDRNIDKTYSISDCPDFKPIEKKV